MIMMGIELRWYQVNEGVGFYDPSHFIRALRIIKNIVEPNPTLTT